MKTSLGISCEFQAPIESQHSPSIGAESISIKSICLGIVLSFLQCVFEEF
jgi:hypothetical protein